jgi:PTH1 family peptidyl-tRNA hydrolase
MSLNPPSSDTPYLIVGLGNPGPRYARTRHNVGFVAVEELARRHGLRFAGGRAHSEVAKGKIGDAQVIVAKPQTYMNLSGRAVQGLSHFYKVPTERVIIVYDDFALPLGTLRLREKGSAGGHNGLESVIRHLGTQSFPRLRVGVGGPPGGKHTHMDWVLGRFTKEEEPIVADTVSRAADAVESVFRIGLERTMNEYNTRGPSTDDSSPTAHRRTTDDSKTKAKDPSVHERNANSTQSTVLTTGTQHPTPETWAERVRRIIRGERRDEA